MTTNSIDKSKFKQILSRNVSFPLILSGVLCAVFVSLGFYLLSVSHWVDHADEALAKTSRLLRLIVDSETGTRGFLLTGRPHFLEPFDWGSASMAPEIASLKEFVADNPPQVDRAEKLYASYLKWHAYAAHAIELKRENPNYQDFAAEENGKSMMDGMRQQILAIQEVEQKLRDNRVATANDLTRIFLLVIVVFTFGSGGVLAYIGRRQLLALSRTYDDALETQVKQGTVLQRQDWLRRGQTELNDKLRGELRLDQICQNALSFFVAYLGADVGAIYLSDGRVELKRAAAYALDGADEEKHRTFKLGEGLVGQAAVDRKVIDLTTLPANYLHVSSGLGKAPPQALVIAPMEVDGLVNAVVELAFIDSSGLARAKEFLHLVAENVSVAIKSSRYRQRLEELLSESQAQAEELQAQQEELRVSNEELEEQTKALKSAQARLESQHAELEQTNEQLEEQTRALEHQKDVLDQKNEDLSRASASLQEKKRELESTNQYKSEFLANMSHELRTPLNSTLILAKLLADNPSGNLNAEQTQFAKTIYSSGNDLLTLINDILDLSKVEAGKLEIFPEPVKLPKLVETLKRTFGPVAAEKHLDFVTTMASDLPASVMTDQLRVEQILKNFLSNAFKFTESGQVKLDVRREGKSVVFDISDTGIGIPGEQQEIIFEAFRQADGTTNRKYGGTGLGLSISRDLTRLLGGEIRVRSEAGRGSVFSLVLPEEGSAVPVEARQEFVPHVAPPAAPSTGKPSLPKPRAPVAEDDREKFLDSRKTLLVIEDDPNFAKILFELAHAQNFNCLLAASADEGLSLARNYLPDAIVLDMKLPDHNGLSVLDLLKEDTRLRPIPVHVISAQDLSVEALRMGAVGYLLKPVKQEALLEAFHKLEAKITQQIKRVLVVEDDATQREGICRLIGNSDVQTVAVASGREALQRLGELTFDCMVVDLTLPDMSGYELLELMTGNENGAFPPVIIYTGRSLTRDEEEKLLRYSRSVIIKGARSPERLLDEVGLFVHRVESRLSPERQNMLREFRHREKVFESRKILLADDDVRNIFALTSALEQKGASMVIARNGREALQKVTDDPTIELVLMDIMMPEMDGYQTMREIRKRPEFAKLPIIAITAKAMKDDQERCLQAGANDYLAKPVDLDKLMSLIRVWLPSTVRI